MRCNDTGGTFADALLPSLLLLEVLLALPLHLGELFLVGGRHSETQAGGRRHTKGRLC